jgi:hypothetical protein
MKIRLKTCDANKGLPVGRKQSRKSFRAAGQAHRASFQEKKAGGSWMGKQSFVEDFIGEHSLPGLHVPLIGIAGSF